MILLSSSAVLKISLGGSITTNQLVWTTHYVDISSTSFVPGENDGLTNNTTQIIIITSPSSGLSRQTKYISVYNTDTVAQTLSIILNAGTDRIIMKLLLQPAYTLYYNLDSGWTVVDVNGSIQYVGSTGPTGVTGATGATGSTGSNGINAYTTTSANFTQPAVASTVNVTVVATSWMASGQILYVQDGSGDGGYYSVNSITSGTVVVLKNLGYSDNSSSSTTINSGAAVVAGGLLGPTGATGSAGATGSQGPQDYLYLTNN